jgi:hypothetical protein
VPPSPSSIEGVLVTCCASELAAQVLVVGHHGSRTSSRRAFLDAVGASAFVVSSGPKKYSSVVLSDADVIAELEARGQLFRTDVDDAACGANTAKIGPDADGRAGGCDNVRLLIGGTPPVQVSVFHGRRSALRAATAALLKVSTQRTRQHTRSGGAGPHHRHSVGLRGWPGAFVTPEYSIEPTTVTRPSCDG